MKEIFCYTFAVTEENLMYLLIRSPDVFLVLFYTTVCWNFPEHLLNAYMCKWLQMVVCLIFSSDAQGSGEDVLLSVLQPNVSFILAGRWSYKVICFNGFRLSRPGPSWLNKVWSNQSDLIISLQRKSDSVDYVYLSFGFRNFIWPSSV